MSYSPWNSSSSLTSLSSDMEEFSPYATYQAAVDAKVYIRREMPQDFTQVNITGNDATGWLVKCLYWKWEGVRACSEELLLGIVCGLHLSATLGPADAGRV